MLLEANICPACPVLDKLPSPCNNAGSMVLIEGTERHKPVIPLQYAANKPRGCIYLVKQIHLIVFESIEKN